MTAASLNAWFVAAAFALGSGRSARAAQPAARNASPDASQLCLALRMYAEDDAATAVSAIRDWPIAQLRRLVQLSGGCTGRGSTAAYAVLLLTDVALTD